MSKRIRFMLLLIALSPVLEAREPDLSLPNGQFDRQQPMEKQKADRSTWFGIGYESRREQTERENFEDSAMRRSVFSGGGGGFSSSGGGGVSPPAGGGGGGRR
jgi:uncharacterized membrane protein